MADTPRSPALFALLIGIDHYCEYPLANGLYYPKLGGCVRDSQKVRTYLLNRLGLEPSHLVQLIASNGGEAPSEAPEHWPTYANIVSAFNELTEKVRAGDQLFIHYSGHGGRTTTMFPDLKGTTGFDEALVPLDIGKPGDPGARYLRDVELHSLLQDLVEKEVRLTVVLDCCHSGGATRSIGGARKRGIGQADAAPLPPNSAVGDLSTLIQRWQTTGAPRTRSLGNQSSWLFEPRGYTLLAACRASESAMEFPFDGGKPNGALTYWMLDTLHQAGPNTTWQRVAERVAAKVHSQFSEQTPMVQGEGDYRVFGADRLQSHLGVPVLQVNPAQNQVRIGAGEAHGVATGTRFQIVPGIGIDADAAGTPLALVEVIRVGGTDAWASMVDGSGNSPQAAEIEVGSQAIMLNTSAVRIQRTAHVAIDDADLRRQMEASIQADGRGFVALADSYQGADFLIDRHQDRADEWVVQETSGSPIPNLRPAIQTIDPHAAAKLTNRLVHLAQFRNVQSLDMPDARMADKLKVTLDAPPTTQPGDTVRLTITNSQTVNPTDPNDPDRILNITVLALSSDWSIEQIYPSGAARFEPLDPGASIPLEFEAYLPDGQDESLDIIKVFATRNPTNFRWLELPPLDQPPTPGATRSLISDPLEQLLSQVTGENATTRAILLNASPKQDRGWTVAQVEVVVRR